MRNDIKNPHGYLLDELHQPKCPQCGKSTNKAYRLTANLNCWHCGADMKPKAEPVERKFGAITTTDGSVPTMREAIEADLQMGSHNLNDEIRRPGPDAPETNPRRQPGSPASNG